MKKIDGFKIEFPVDAPENEDEATEIGRSLGSKLFNETAARLQRTMIEAGAPFGHVTNTILNAHVITLAHVLNNVITGMDGKPEALTGRSLPIVKDLAEAVGDILAKYASRGTFAIRERRPGGRE